MVGDILQTIRPLGDGDVADPRAGSSRILVVDDNASNRDLLSRRLVREGYCVTAAENGAAALALTAAANFDLVLLDLMMPGMSGFEVLCRLKAEAGTRHIPVIMISALDELDSTVRCIEAGAEDYLPKPFNPILLRARIGACLEKKRLLDELNAEKERSEALLLNILPRTIVERMRRGETVIADRIAEATILFADLVDFTSFAAKSSPEETVALLGEIFSRFDALAARHGLEKIKTTGDGYMVAGGLPEERPDHAVAVAEMALAMLDAVETGGRTGGEPFRLRIGLNTGALIAGVLGTHNFVYDVYFYAKNLPASQALEFDINQFTGSRSFIWGHECRIAGGHQWDIWNNVTNRWMPTGIPCYPVNNAWNHLVIQVQRTAKNQLLFKSITLNGKTATLNYVEPSTATSWYGVTINYQQDGNKVQQAYSIWLDRLNFSAW